MSDSMFIKSWALKWIEGSILSYLRGSTPLNVVVGRIRRSLISYGVSVGDVKVIVERISQDSAYLPYLTRKEKDEMLEPLRKALREIVQGSAGQR